MKITEIQAEEMMKEGADMRHVLKAAYQLKPKCISKMKFKKGTKLNGRAVLNLLNFDKYKEKEEEDEQKQRMSRAWAEYEQRLNRGKGVKPPPGFENLDQAIAKKINDEVEEPEFLVSYANGTNTLTLASQPIVVHDVTVSCVVDSCRVFLQHMNEPNL
jgi:polysaccharide pyruvyl transferase WcaK-like protein